MSASSEPTLPPHSEAFLAEINAQLKQQLDAATKELEYARLKIRVLEEHLRLRRIAKYGPGSEKLSDLQLQLLEEEPGVSSQEVQAESGREVLPGPGEEKKRQRRAHPGRQTLPADLPRVEKIVACTAGQCVCGKCGKETMVIGYEESQVLNVKPAEYYVEVIKREKRACRQCEEQGVAMAPLPPRIIEKSLVSDQVIIDTNVEFDRIHKMSPRVTPTASMHHLRPTEAALVGDVVVCLENSLEGTQKLRWSFASAAHAEIENHTAPRRSVLPEIRLMIPAALVMSLHIDRSHVDALTPAAWAAKAHA